jgi:hypothetical protein
MTKSICAVLLLFLSFSAQAEHTESSGEYTKEVNSLRTTFPQNDEYFGDWTPHLKGGWVSQNDSIRPSEKGDRTYQGKQEFYLGVRTKAGWSLSGMMVQYAYDFAGSNPKTAYGKPALDHWETGDASVTLGHPTLFQNANWSINGQFRVYFLNSVWSSTHDVHQYAYYDFINGKVLGGREFLNILIPRYFYEGHYHASDTKYYIEDRTQLGQRFASWFRSGLGQYSQMEAHAATRTGWCSEIYPFADFIISKEFFIGPRVSFPIVASGSVYNGPTMVSWSNVYAEVFGQLTL